MKEKWNFAMRKTSVRYRGCCKMGRWIRLFESGPDYSVQMQGGRYPQEIILGQAIPEYAEKEQITE